MDVAQPDATTAMTTIAAPLAATALSRPMNFAITIVQPLATTPTLAPSTT